MERRLQFEKLIARISSKFVGVYDLDESVNSSLREIGKFSGADRSYLFIYSKNGRVMSNTHEWCKKGVTAQKQILQNIPSKSLPWWTGKLRNHEIVHITDVNKLPKKAQAVKMLLKEQDIKSLLVFPIFTENELIASIGFDNVTEIGEWKKIDFELLNMISEIIGNALHKDKILQRLEESQKKFKKLAANASDAIIIINERNEITFWNRYAEEMFQYKKEEVINQKLADIVIPDKYKETYRQKFSEDMKKDIKPWIGKTKTIIGKRRDGTEFPVEVSHSEIDIEGKWHGVSIIRDLSERKEFERLMRIKDKALETSHDAIAFTDLEGKITYVNQSFLSIWGYENKNEIIGKNSRDFWASREDAIQVISSLNKSGYWTGELEAEAKDKALIYVEVSASMVYDYNSKPISMMGIFRDITEKKKREALIKEQNKKFQLLFEESPHMIVLFDSSFKIVDLNPALLEFAGRSKQELIGKRFTEIKEIYTKNIGIYKEKLKELLSSGKVEGIELRVPNKDNEMRWVEFKGALINLQNRQLIQVIMRDITEIKEIQMNLKKLNKYKTYILRKTSHELKTPLISIKGFSELILEQYKDKLNPEIISYLREIQNGSKRLEKLVTDLLKSSELDSYKFELNLERYNLSKIIESALNDIKSFATKRRIKTVKSIENKLISQMDKERIYEVIINLLSNAIKYTPEGGKISILASKEKERIITSVKDTGIGFTDKEKKKAFKQFGKIKRPQANKKLVSEGSGLGLYIAKRIIELHNGEIWFTSEGRNKGTTFYFTLPIIG